MRGRGIAGAVLATFALTGCGGDDPEPPRFSGTDEEQVAATVNAMFDAIEAGDGETACGLMSERGQRIWVKIVRRNPETGGSGETCVEAVETSDPTDSGIRVSADDVSIEIDQEGATVTNDFGGVLTMEKVDGIWRVLVPTFVN